VTARLVPAVTVSMVTVPAVTVLAVTVLMGAQAPNRAITGGEPASSACRSPRVLVEPAEAGGLVERFTGFSLARPRCPFAVKAQQNLGYSRVCRSNYLNPSLNPLSSRSGCRRSRVAAAIQNAAMMESVPSENKNLSVGPSAGDPGPARPT